MSTRSETASRPSGGAPQGEGLSAHPLGALDDVTLLERLGEGLGAGRYRARLSALPALASLLIYDERHGDAQIFIEWARRLEAVEHPVMPAVLRIEQVLHPHYVAQRLVEGELLSQRLRTRPQAWPQIEALGLILQLAAALRGVHQRGLAHGRLEARQVLLTQRAGAFDAVHLVGWQPLGGRPTAEDWAQAMRADVDALGGLLYHLLAGAARPSDRSSALQSPHEPVSAVPDQVLMGFVSLDTEASRQDFARLCAPGRFETIDAFTDAILPYFSRALGESLDELTQRVGAHRSFQAQVEAQRTQLHELESKQRFVRQWLRDHAEQIDRLDDQLKYLNRRGQALENLRMEVAMLNERPLESGARVGREGRAWAAGRPSLSSYSPPAPYEEAAALDMAPTAEAPSPLAEGLRSERAAGLAEDEGPASVWAPEGAQAEGPRARGGRGLIQLVATLLVAVLLGVGASWWWLSRGSQPAPSEGDPGAQTAQGEPGAQTAQGEPGAQVAQGDPGAQTAQGEPGAQVAQGDPGAQVPEGIAQDPEKTAQDAAAPAEQAEGIAQDPEKTAQDAAAPAEQGEAAAQDPEQAAPLAPPESPPAEAQGPPVPAPSGMVYVPPGQLQQGLSAEAVERLMALCRSELAAHKNLREQRCTAENFAEERALAEQPPVAMAGFFIDRLEVSQSEWDACRQAGKCGMLKLRWDLPNQPATGVTQAMAQRYCAWRGGRLPTHLEWQYAARGGSAQIFPWGDGAPLEGDHHRDNYGAPGRTGGVAGGTDGHKYAAPVGTFAERSASPFGVSNLAGNVREWSATQPSPKTGLVVGGGWRDLGIDLRLTRAESLPADKFSNELGLRCVRDLPTP